MKKKLGCILLTMLFVLPFSACGESEESKQIEELKALLTAQSQTLAELGGALSSLQTDMQTQNATLKELQAIVTAQAEEIEYLQYKIKMTAGLMVPQRLDLKTAYKNQQIKASCSKTNPVLKI